MAKAVFRLRRIMERTIEIDVPDGATHEEIVDALNAKILEDGLGAWKTTYNKVVEHRITADDGHLISSGFVL